MNIYLLLLIMAACLRKKIFQKGRWYLEFPLKIGGGGRSSGEGKILNYLSAGRKLMGRRKVSKEHCPFLSLKPQSHLPSSSHSYALS